MSSDLTTSSGAPATSPSSAAGAKRKHTINARLLAAYRAFASGLTADEAADAAGIAILTARPAITRLLKAGLLIDTGVTRDNVTKHKARVLKTAPTPPTV